MSSLHPAGRSAARRGLVALLPILAVLAACARNPVTGERELSLISESQEIQMGQQAAKDVESSIGLVQDTELQAYVRGIGARLAAKSERPRLPWSFGVVDDPTPNAFALPGGQIYITRGLLTLMDSEAELASVLGHEIGHVTAKHSVSQLSRAQLAQLGLGLGMIFVPQAASLGNVLAGGMQLLFLKYGRDDERQADDLGFKYALSENYDVREMDDVFAQLKRAGEQEGQQSALPTWLSTHPGPDERIQRINETIAKTTLPANLVANRTQFYAQLEGTVYGSDPRQGFFRETLFLHPDMRFQLQFPSGWKTQNLSQAVMAGSPQQDAAMQLTLAQGTAEQAANTFFGQQGIERSQVSRETINGLPAVSGYFRVQTQDGLIAGLATFVQHNGRVFQLLAYTPSTRLQAYDQAFRAAANSFAALTNQQDLSVKPNRISIVRLSSSMSLAEFNRRNPSVIPINELALINQVQDPNATLTSGTSIKRVTAS